MFGKEIKDRIEISQIKNIEKKGLHDIHLISVDGKKDWSIKFKTERDDAFNIISSLWKKNGLNEELRKKKTKTPTEISETSESDAGGGGGNLSPYSSYSPGSSLGSPSFSSVPSAGAALPSSSLSSSMTEEKDDEPLMKEDWDLLLKGAKNHHNQER
eukprot:TRINITY_DN7695_c0_g1_i1.p1 TRINITY_DN7695_c0_g1~~TRINITY_DN7695_c0_g1_i1.p1  ORF type:complete len:167 (-),score=82.62 TRINITY_DN7695_c0_g1_i1:324-794(-)